MPNSPDELIELANSRLKAAYIKVKIERRKGGMLTLRGTFPAKPGSGRHLPHQQRIPLGWPATPQGIKKAEAKAVLVRAYITDGSFDWDDYLDGSDRNPLRLSILIKNFEKHYRARSKMLDRTWKTGWIRVFRQLPQDKPLTADMVRAFVESKAPHSASRKEACTKLQRLCDYAGISIDLAPLAGNYSHAKRKHFELPPDELIAEWRDRIPNDGWRWHFGVMAAYGLRPHETFFCEFVRDDNGNPTPELKVLKGKTGPRVVAMALYPEWWERWQLWDIQKTRTKAERAYENMRLNDPVMSAFTRYGVPFHPYALRHAFAVRASVVFELPVTTSAVLMGHSPAIHLETYQRYIRGDQVRRSVERAVEKEGRAIAP